MKKKKKVNGVNSFQLGKQNLPIAIMTAAALLFVPSPELQRWRKGQSFFSIIWMEKSTPSQRASKAKLQLKLEASSGELVSKAKVHEWKSFPNGIVRTISITIETRHQIFHKIVDSSGRLFVFIHVLQERTCLYHLTGKSLDGFNFAVMQ